MKKGASGRSRALECAIGITVHTGWGACVVVSGSPRNPQIIGNRVIDLLDGAERFCYHRAAEMKAASVPEWLEQKCRREHWPRREAGSRASTPSNSCASAPSSRKTGSYPDPNTALATHMRIHLAEGLFYRDVFRDACQILSVASRRPASLDITAVGKIDTKPWSRDQKLAALAAWQAMSH